MTSLLKEPWLGSMFRDTVTGKLNETRAAHAINKMINVSKTQPTKGMAFKNGPGKCRSTGMRSTWATSCGLLDGGALHAGSQILLMLTFAQY